jgi:hypothetical protein
VNAQFEAGELVDVAIRDARVVETTPGHLQLGVGGGQLFIATVMLPSVDITRAAPKGWPARPGDVWADESGAEWFARSGGPGDATVYLTSARAGFVSEDPDQILALDGPLRLVRRAGTDDIAQAGQVAGPDSPQEGPATAADDGALPELIQPRPITDPALTDPANDPVWVAAERKGIDYHALPSGSRTTCGRATAKGHRLRRAEAAEFGRPCKRCYPALEG